MQPVYALGDSSRVNGSQQPNGHSVKSAAASIPKTATFVTGKEELERINRQHIEEAQRLMLFHADLKEREERMIAQVHDMREAIVLLEKKNAIMERDQKALAARTAELNDREVAVEKRAFDVSLKEALLHEAYQALDVKESSAHRTEKALLLRHLECREAEQRNVLWREEMVSRERYLSSFVLEVHQCVSSCLHSLAFKEESLRRDSVQRTDALDRQRIEIAKATHAFEAKKEEIHRMLEALRKAEKDLESRTRLFDTTKEHVLSHLTGMLDAVLAVPSESRFIDNTSTPTVAADAPLPQQSLDFPDIEIAEKHLEAVQRKCEALGILNSTRADMDDANGNYTCRSVVAHLAQSLDSIRAMTQPHEARERLDEWWRELARCTHELSGP